MRYLLHTVFSQKNVCAVCKAVGSYEPVSSGDKGCIIVTAEGKVIFNYLVIFTLFKTN